MKPPGFLPTDEDLSVGAPDFLPTDENLSVGAPGLGFQPVPVFLSAREVELEKGLALVGR